MTPKAHDLKKQGSLAQHPCHHTTSFIVAITAICRHNQWHHLLKTKYFTDCTHRDTPRPSSFYNTSPNPICNQAMAPWRWECHERQPQHDPLSSALFRLNRCRESLILLPAKRSPSCLRIRHYIIYSTYERPLRRLGHARLGT